MMTRPGNYTASRSPRHSANAGTMVLDGVSGVLGAYSDYQADMADWYGAETP